MGKSQKTINHQLKDGDGIQLKVGDKFSFQCCDCSLVHNVKVSAKDDTFVLTFERNSRMTGQRRRRILEKMQQLMRKNDEAKEFGNKDS